ncbi:MAG: hypothetical protein JW891_18120 [Candidatus Lokiarchaeota archaeon]|nr:hypothetical protein [Candidatus Lokiarchaeota archaeon]
MNGLQPKTISHINSISDLKIILKDCKDICESFINDYSDNNGFIERYKKIEQEIANRNLRNNLSKRIQVHKNLVNTRIESVRFNIKNINQEYLTEESRIKASLQEFLDKKKSGR